MPLPGTTVSVQRRQGRGEEGRRFHGYRCGSLPRLTALSTSLSGRTAPTPEKGLGSRTRGFPSQVEGGRIVEVQSGATRSPGIADPAIAGIPRKWLKENKIDVDAVSLGATFTSRKASSKAVKVQRSGRCTDIGEIYAGYQQDRRRYLYRDRPPCIKDLRFPSPFLTVRSPRSRS